uniref:Uncharacterized protein n=1 Tax=Arundo donax TaxID=35708 RepID=A0A0A8Z261_ARUDO
MHICMPNAYVHTYICSAANNLKDYHKASKER